MATLSYSAFFNYHFMRRPQHGFTFVETAVILGVVVILTSVLLLYNRSGQRQLLLIREKAKVIGYLLRAKSASIVTLVSEEPVCGYGVYFTETAYLLFKDLASDCSLSDHIYSSENTVELVEEVRLPPGLRFFPLEINHILFVPPDPQTFLDGNQSSAAAVLTLTTTDNQSSVKIKVTDAGQISE